MYKWHRTIISFASIALFFLMVFSAYAVDTFRVSEYGSGHQIWFEAENFDERIPEGDEFFPVVDEEGAFGQAIGRDGGAGGTIIWAFDISLAGGKGGEWYFRGRIKNVGNPSDWMLVDGDPDDEIPDGPPFPGGEGAFPEGGNQLIFEKDSPEWAWHSSNLKEGHIKTLQDGLNTMYILHRQAHQNVFWDVFVWADDMGYMPTDDDYLGAEEIAGTEAVQPGSKLSTTWAAIKAR